MGSYKTDQHHVVHRGRTFHFVSYEAKLANPRTGELATGPTWCLMSAGKRWPVRLQVAGEDPEALVAALTVWLDHNVFGARHA